MSTTSPRRRLSAVAPSRAAPPGASRSWLSPWPRRRPRPPPVHAATGAPTGTASATANQTGKVLVTTGAPASPSRSPPPAPTARPQRQGHRHDHRWPVQGDALLRPEQLNNTSADRDDHVQQAGAERLVLAARRRLQSSRGPGRTRTSSILTAGLDRHQAQQREGRRHRRRTRTARMNTDSPVGRLQQRLERRPEFDRPADPDQLRLRPGRQGERRPVHRDLRHHLPVCT